MGRRSLCESNLLATLRLALMVRQHTWETSIGSTPAASLFDFSCKSVHERRNREKLARPLDCGTCCFRLGGARSSGDVLAHLTTYISVVRCCSGFQKYIQLPVVSRRCPRAPNCVHFCTELRLHSIPRTFSCAGSSRDVLGQPTAYISVLSCCSIVSHIHSAARGPHAMSSCT